MIFIIVSPAYAGIHLIEQGLAEVPPTEEDIEELLEIPWRGEPDAISYHYALQAIRRARARREREKRGGSDDSSGDDPDEPDPGGMWGGHGG